MNTTPQPPTFRRRFRFSLRTLLVVVTLAGIGVWSWEAVHPHGLRRTWKGMQRINGYTFRFDRTQLHINNHLGTVATPYTTANIKNVMTIDFDGAYGKQLGIYQIDEQRGVLTMIVADPGVKRPTKIGSVDVIGKNGRMSNFVRYVLQRSD